MAEVIVDGVVYIKADTSGLKKGMQDATGSINEFEKAVGNLNTVVAGAYAFMGLQVLQFGGQVIQTGADFQSRHAGFVNLVKGDTDKFLNELRRATEGTVKDIELMTSTNRALLQGVSQQDLPMLFEAAEKLGSVVGMDTSQAFDVLTRAMETQNEKSLLALGITINLEAEYKKLGLTIEEVGKLSESRQKGIYDTVLLEKVSEKTKQVNSDLDAQADKLEAAKAGWENFKASLGTGGLLAFDFLTGGQSKNQGMEYYMGQSPNFTAGQDLMQKTNWQNFPGVQANKEESITTESNMAQFNRARAMLEEREAILKNNDVTEESIRRLDELTKALSTFSNAVMASAKASEEAAKIQDDISNKRFKHGGIIEDLSIQESATSGYYKTYSRDGKEFYIDPKTHKLVPSARSNAS